MFLKPDHPYLSMRAEEVHPEALLTDIPKMLDQLYAVAARERQDTSNGFLVGLAAPQIGIMKRILLVDVEADDLFKKLGPLQAYINPEIIAKSPEEAIGPEDCYSVDPRICGAVRRALWIKIKALDRTGKPLEEEFSGFAARVFQHELDHLDGIRFPDRIVEENKLHWVENHEYLDYLQSWKTWSKYCPLASWKAMKEGK